MTKTDEVLRALSGFAVHTMIEEELGDVVEQKLREAGIDFIREHRLSGRDRIDFLLLGGIGLELKVQGNHGSLIRQLHRYAEHEGIASLVVVTTQRRLCRLPESLRDKPLFAIFLGGV